MAVSVAQKLTKALGARIVKTRALPGGDIADVSLLTLDNHTEVVAKRPRSDQPDTTAVEAMMLRHLAAKSTLPVPKVLFQSKGILVMGFIPNKGITNPVAAAEDIALHVARLHRVKSKSKQPFYGLDKETVIGPLPQINTPASNWCDFFTENRLMAMAQSCMNVSRFDTRFMARIEKLAATLPNLLPATPESSLLHGDLWAGNMLVDGDKAVGFIDPAISYGHREMDLAFMALMGGLDPAFFDAYHAAYPLDAGFQEERKALYQLWPLLVHLRLFGSGYQHQVESILEQFGC
ncbi:MAG: fructosamine kinase family protein [Kordiimonadaceae bacterium]|nr:fructosamine kinase family protein [Kordiimonadaceae bacterium]